MERLQSNFGWQPVKLTSILTWLLFTSSICLSRTLHVPTAFSTIQSAFNELLTNDTVLVDSGLYVEELSAPGFSFVMMGNVGADTTGRLRPTIDPSGLSGPTGRGCLILSSGNVRIRDVAFRNSAPMYPHVQGDVGGISMGSANLILSRCRFDSVHYGVISYPHNGSHTVQLDHCDFAHASGRCVFASRILAESCTFHSDTNDWAQLTFSSNTVINNCSFSGDFWGGNVLLGGGWNVRITNCIFANFEFAPASSALVLRIGLSEVSNNVFSNYLKGQSVLQVSTLCEYGPNVISGNLFENLHTPESHAYLTAQCLVLGANDGDPELCPAAQVFDNVFINCTSTIGAVGISASANCDIQHNRFVRMSCTDGPVVLFQDIPHVFHDNVFLENGLTVSAGDLFMTVQAEWNYWGDPTGPYHPILNPDGLGDPVGDSVDFDPWYTDTLFWTNIENSEPQLVSNWHLLSLYPNPFNNEFRINIAGFTHDDFVLSLYNLLGHEVAVLYRGSIMGGSINYTAPPELSSGVYFVRAADHNIVETGKVVLLK